MLVVPIENPKAIVDDGRKPSSAPIELDLSVGSDALAVRSIDYDPERKLYWIVAGSFESGGKFMLFHWSGKASDRPKPFAK